ncbi:hypothetical protein [Spiroplasma endosymbiont of Lonchoptera lutea]|uniref:hypothetical protein n=1 Tax=Spiroplasma endosymbiont of Lonchoptera lutea TaxID=3066297 RepID=UPI0030CF5205
MYLLDKLEDISDKIICFLEVNLNYFGITIWIGWILQGVAYFWTPDKDNSFGQALYAMVWFFNWNLKFQDLKWVYLFKEEGWFVVQFIIGIVWILYLIFYRFKK